jgi:3-oxoacyl-[acyl-carrier-protein] synthase III
LIGALPGNLHYFRLSLHQALDRNDHTTARLFEQTHRPPRSRLTSKKSKKAKKEKKAVIKAAVKAAKKAAKKAFKQGRDVKSKKRRRSEKLDRETDS